MRPDQQDYRAALAGSTTTRDAPAMTRRVRTRRSPVVCLRPRRRDLAGRRAHRARGRGHRAACAPPGCAWRSCRTTRTRRSATSSPSSTAWACPRRPTRWSPAPSRPRGCWRSRCRPAPGCSCARGPGVREALGDVGLVAVDERPGRRGGGRLPPRVRLRRASTARRRRCAPGARFVATNLDATYPIPGGLIPGAGSLVAAVATAAGRHARGGGQAGGADGRADPRALRHHRRGGGRPAVDRRRARRRRSDGRSRWCSRA